jgi:cytochrome b561
MIAPTEVAQMESPMSAARWARIGYSLVAWLFAIASVVQVYLAGQGIFVPPESFELHRNVGYGIGILALIMLVLAFAARMPFRIIGVTALLFVLMILQSVLVFMRTDQPNLAALHPVNGFLIVLLAVWIAWKTLGYIRAPLPPEPVHEAPPPPPAAPSQPPREADEDSF